MVIELSDTEKRKKVDVKNEDGKKEKLPLYFDGESVSGRVSGRGLTSKPSCPSLDTVRYPFLCVGTSEFEGQETGTSWHSC